MYDRLYSAFVNADWFNGGLLPFMEALDPGRAKARSTLIQYGEEFHGNPRDFYTNMTPEKATELSLAFLRYYGHEGV